METVLELTGVTRQFKQQKALDNVSLAIKKGEIYGLIGRNGAGKTTMLKTITRLIPPTSGQVALFGSTGSHQWTQALRRTGSVIETPVAYEQLTAQENLAYYCQLRGIVEAEKVIKSTLELVELPMEKKRFKDFSLGMKQKLGIAIAIVSRPDLLILDEPINGLDPIAIVAFRRLMKRLNEELGMTIIISSHILTELYQVADRFGILDQGVLVKEITKQEFDEHSTEYIVLHTSMVEQTAKVLQENFAFKFKVVGENELHIFEKSHQINQIITVLVKQQLPIDGIYYSKQDLEKYFTELLAQGGQADA